ncbi:complement C5 [Sceloporus undulatus]|uniref:complement C5 n=1 Tax=Sceloporus undulatus TaxID=8520 RepID=UPI001C4CB67B|nr:complement C5 [Sceloporus undulatus]
MNLLGIFLFLTICGKSLAQEQTYVISAPKNLRVAASEKVVIQAFGYEEEFPVTISIKSFPDKQTTYAFGRTQLTPDNSFQGAVILTLQPKDLSSEDPKASVQYVYLEAVSPHFTKEKKMPVTYDNGFLFVQTDKPIYTPDQTVKVRVYSLNEELRPARRAATLTFVDPEDVEVDIIKEEDITGIISFPDFKIPPYPKYGIWKIKAKYQKDFTTTAEARFQVKEYAMPSFSVTIEPENNFIGYQHFERFKITIRARYFYNAPVPDAQVYVRFGIIEGTSKTMMPKALRHIEMEEGIAEFYFNSKSAVSKLSYNSLQELDGLKLYIAASVLETKGGHTEDSELTSVMYVMSPYKLNLIATPFFVKPGLPYFIKVQAKDPVGVPASNLPIVLTASVFNEAMEETTLVQEGTDAGRRETSSNDGTALFVLNIPLNAKVLEFRIKTADAQLPEENQASESYEAKSYISLSGSYLYIDWASNHKTLHVGNNLHIGVHPSSHYIDKIHHYSYLIISKGKIITYGTQPKLEGYGYQTLQFQLTKDMVPSARVLVYYIVTGEGAAELVADSVWLNIEQKCGNSLEVHVSGSQSFYKPKEVVSLSMKTQFDALVALSSVDKAIYGVTDRKEKPMEKALLRLEKSDLGCGAGGGQNNVDVFRKSGLTFMTNANAEDSNEEDEACQALVRSTRSIQRNEMDKLDITCQAILKAAPSTVSSKIEELVSLLQHPTVKECCRAGAQEYPVKQTCNERLRHVKGGPRCIKAYQKCCICAELLRSNDTHKNTILGRSVFAALLDLDPEVRSYFPESWLWEVHPVSSSKTLPVTLPDSLTTWEIQGVSISDQGICVADALQVQVVKEVFINVHIPYSVVRGEQIELIGTVYNYRPSGIVYCTSISVDKGICLSGASSTNRQGVQRTSCTPYKDLQGSSIAKVQFKILPLELGVHTINFTLRSSASNEILVKTLRVVPEGIRKELHEGYTLDPQGVYGTVKRQLEFRHRVPLNMVPKTSLERTVSVKGLLLGDVINAVVDPEGLKFLANLPRGSAETELMNVVPVFYVYDYLQRTDSWDILGQGSITPQLNMKRRMKEGIISILSFRNQEYAFSMWKDGEPSTWVTAFALRIFGQVHRYVPVDQNSLCNTLTWMIDVCQMDDGSFREVSSYQPIKLQGTSAKEMKEKTLYLTAFSLIGFVKAIHICPLQKAEEAKNKAVDYLLQNVESSESTFSLAIATYALALTRMNHRRARMAYSLLKNEALVKVGQPTYRFWKESKGDSSVPSESTARMVETTAYALLTTLLRADKAYADPIIKWLSEQQRYGGGFYSTQDTINALESLTEYSVLVRRLVLNMNVKVAYKKHGDFHQFRLTRNHYVGRPVEASLEDDIEVRSGSNTGLAIVNLKSVYYKSSISEDVCNFALKIDVKSETDSDGRETYYRSSHEVRHLEACAKYKPPKSEPYSASSHAVMDIALVSGLEANMEDLAVLTNKIDQLIANYEVTDGHVLLQLDSIPSNEFLCIGFRILEIFHVSMPSPGTFTVYEYHTPDKQCAMFYNPYGEESLVRLCEGAECKCMEAECGRMQAKLDQSISIDARKDAACQSNIAYVYKVNILSSKQEGGFVKYRAVLMDYYKTGAAFAENNAEIFFIKKYSCAEVQLNPKENYLIMGKEALKIGEGVNARYQYPLDALTWIEWWPSEDLSCRSCQDFAASMEEFAEDLFLNGC